MKVEKLILGELQTNSFIIIGENNHCVIVDPGAQANRVIDTLTRLELHLEAVLITHCHFDHIGAADEIAKKYGVDIIAHNDEGIKMMDSQKNLSALFMAKALTVEMTHAAADGDVLNYGNGLEFICIEVPGHTENSLCFYHKDGLLFSGDTLFNYSIGRTDLYSGSPYDLQRNIRRKLLELPKDTIVYPGHGIKTTIGIELKDNPYLA